MFSEGGAERQAELPPGEAQEFHQQGRQVGLGASSGDRWTVAKELLAALPLSRQAATPVGWVELLEEN